VPKRSDKLVTLPVSGTALLLIDVINDLAFDGSQGLVAQAEPMAARLLPSSGVRRPREFPPSTSTTTSASGDLISVERSLTVPLDRRPADWCRGASAPPHATTSCSNRSTRASTTVRDTS